MDAQGYVSPQEVRQALRLIYQSDAETDLYSSLLEFLSDELTPIDEKGHWKATPLLIISAVLLCALLGVFLYFSVGGRGLYADPAIWLVDMVPPGKLTKRLKRVLVERRLFRRRKTS